MLYLVSPSSLSVACRLFLAVLLVPSLAAAADRKEPATNIAGAPVVRPNGEHINYDRATLDAMLAKVANPQRPEERSNSETGTASIFAPAAGGATQPFWQYAIFGSGIGASDIVIGPKPVGGGAPEIIIGGSSGSYFGGDDFWQVLRHNTKTGNYDQIFVSQIYGSDGDYNATIRKIGLADVTGDANPEIVVMLGNGDIYLYDFATKTEIGEIETGVTDLLGLSLTDLTGDGRAELIVTTSSDLFVFSGTGALLWKVLGAGGYDVVAGQMDNDPAIEIATTSGNVVDSATHSVQWTRNGGFGSYLKLAPLPGEAYQQLIAAQAWDVIYAYDIARQLPRWSISVFNVAAIQVADVDNDGVPELIIGDAQWGTVHVHDLVTQAMKWQVNNPDHGVTDVAIADVDGDGVVDLLWGAGYTDTGSDYLYVANTTGAHEVKWRSIDLQGPFLGPIIGDLDGDGKPEMVICSYSSESGYDSGRILVFDLATLELRGISAPVVNDYAWTGVHDLKLRDVNGDGRMEIVIGADYLYDGVIEIYSFDSSNTFTRTWTNSTRPSGSPFNFVEVADLDGNGTQKVIGANFVEHTGSPGVFVYVYDYPSGTNSWTSLSMASGFSGASGMIVQDLLGSGRKEIATLVGNGDLYTFDGPTRQLRNLLQSTGATMLSSRSTPSGLITSDAAGVGHFLQYGSNEKYTETLTRQLATATPTGVNVMPDGTMWIGSGDALSLRLPPSYSSVAWQSSVIGIGFGRFVATDVRNGQNCVFSSAKQALVGLTYSTNGSNTSYTLTVTAVNGAVAKSPNQATYPSGSQVILTATPSSGYQFTSWSGNASGSTNPLTVTMDSNKSITANFSPNSPASVATPRISPNGGTFRKKASFTLSCATSNAKIYYTLDGTEPTTSSRAYAKKAVKLSGRGTHIVKTMAAKTGLSNSATATAAFTIN